MEEDIMEKPISRNELFRAYNESARLISNLGALIARLEQRLEKAENKLETHMKEYSQNNTNLALLRQSVETFFSKFKEHDNYEDDNRKEIHTEITNLNTKIETFLNRFAPLSDEKIKEISSVDLASITKASNSYIGITFMRDALIGISAIIVAVQVITNYL